MAELGYLEADAVSHYRLKKTFEGCRTSYRLLMLSELFQRVASPHVGAVVFPFVRTSQVESPR